MKKVTLILLIFLMTGCAVVSDKGRYSNIDEDKNLLCQKETDVIYFIDNVDESYPLNHIKNNAYQFKKTSKAINEILSNSNCFKNITESKIKLSSIPNDTIYLEFNITKRENGFIPFITPVLSLAFPMRHSFQTLLDVKTTLNDKKEFLKVDDSFTITSWLPVILISPFMQAPETYINVKEQELIKVLVLNMKNEGMVK